MTFSHPLISTDSLGNSGVVPKGTLLKIAYDYQMQVIQLSMPRDKVNLTVNNFQVFHSFSPKDEGIIILFSEYNTHRSYFGFHLHHKVENHEQSGEGFHGEFVLEENKTGHMPSHSTGYKTKPSRNPKSVYCSATKKQSMDNGFRNDQKQQKGNILF